MVEKMSHPNRPAMPEPVNEFAAWTILSYLISGPLFYGGLGWLADKWLGTTFIVAVGLLGGMAVSMFIIYRRYVSPPSPPSTIVAGGPDRTNRAPRGKLSRNQASSSQLPDNNQLAGHQPVGPTADTSTAGIPNDPPELIPPPEQAPPPRDQSV
jgi:hypothetical protein